jgi:hypothetical protein
LLASAALFAAAAVGSACLLQQLWSQQSLQQFCFAASAAVLASAAVAAIASAAAVDFTPWPQVFFFLAGSVAHLPLAACMSLTHFSLFPMAFS